MTRLLPKVAALADGLAVALGLKGVVAKRRSGHYLPGRRGWIKTKNRD
jgi:ATP-dependent DNA ligase